MQEIERLKNIMKSLRHPEEGCPWDIKQDFSTVSPYTIEEAYEVADAIERKDMDDLKSELGDLLFQIIFHSEMADEAGYFNFEDVVEGINEKLVRRHPHVFEDEPVENDTQLAKRWEEHKQSERKKKRLDSTSPVNADVDQNESALHGIASTLPALRWSEKIQKRAAATGFDWPDIQLVFDKLEEEVAELKDEIGHADNQHRVLDELGDVLFVCVNIAMHLDINAEQALRHGNLKFISRFTLMEQLLGSDGKSLSDCTLSQMEAYWLKAKKRLQNQILS